MKRIFLLLIPFVVLLGCNAQPAPEPQAASEATAATETPTSVAEKAEIRVDKIKGQDFCEKVLDAERPVMVHFSAEWSQACWKIKPLLRELAAEVDGKAEIYEVALEKDRRLATYHAIQKYPTLVLFEQGRETKRFIGSDALEEAGAELHALAEQSPESGRAPKKADPSQPETIADVDETIPAIASLREFQSQVLNAEGLVLVDFSAAWCVPCQQIKPKLRELAQELAEVAPIYELDTDQHAEIADHYKIDQLPALLLFCSGREVDRFVGSIPKESISEKIHSLRELSQGVPVLTAADFPGKVLRAERPVLVDFSATWCGPCQMMKPRLLALAIGLYGSAEVYEIDVDKNKRLTQFYDVKSYPTLVVFNQGREVRRFVGVHSAETLEAALQSLIEE